MPGGVASGHGNVSADFVIEGFVKLSTDNCSFDSGVLTPWHQESELQLAYYRRPRDAYEVSVDDFVSLAHPQPIQFRKHAAMKSREGLNVIHRTRPLFLPYIGEDSNAWVLLGGDDGVGADPEFDGVGPELVHSEDDSLLEMDIDAGSDDCVDDARVDVGMPASDSYVNEQLREWGINVSANDIGALLLPAPICKLVLCGSWRHIVLRTCWHGDYNGLEFNPRRKKRLPGPVLDWPPPDAEVWRQSGLLYEAALTDGASDLTAANCQTLAFNVRKWASSLPLELVAEVSAAYVSLQLWSGALSVTQNASETLRRSQYFFASIKLLRAVRLSSMLRGGADRLADVVSRALALNLPPELQQSFLQGARHTTIRIFR
jgi:hypothetical protein